MKEFWKDAKRNVVFEEHPPAKGKSIEFFVDLEGGVSADERVSCVDSLQGVVHLLPSWACSMAARAHVFGGPALAHLPLVLPALVACFCHPWMLMHLQRLWPLPLPAPELPPHFKRSALTLLPEIQTYHCCCCCCASSARRSMSLALEARLASKVLALPNGPKWRTSWQMLKPARGVPQQAHYWA